LHLYPVARPPELVAYGAGGVVTSLEDFARELQRSEDEGERDGGESSASAEKTPQAGWRSRARKPLIDVCTVYLVLKHRTAPIMAKAVAGVTIGYVLSPIQLIPSFIPVIGWMDDLLVIWLGSKLMRALTPDTILVECRASAVVMAMRLLRVDPTPPIADPDANTVSARRRAQ
jgi:uncharacterized membrane protein YkvA (DUF1232 family)